LIEVFNPEQRPWIQLDSGRLDEIVAVVEKCPSGALTYTRSDGGAQEVIETPATIVPWPNGPYFVRGSFQVHDRHGNTFDTGPRATLCRCGHSQNHPFCDLSHRENKFSSYPRADDDSSS
jgi:CDGSH-type Zn-finger protein